MDDNTLVLGAADDFLTRTLMLADVSFTDLTSNVVVYNMVSLCTNDDSLTFMVTNRKSLVKAFLETDNVVTFTAGVIVTIGEGDDLVRFLVMDLVGGIVTLVFMVELKGSDCLVKLGVVVVVVFIAIVDFEVGVLITDDLVVLMIADIVLLTITFSATEVVLKAITLVEIMELSVSITKLLVVAFATVDCPVRSEVGDMVALIAIDDARVALLMFIIVVDDIDTFIIPSELITLTTVARTLEVTTTLVGVMVIFITLLVALTSADMVFFTINGVVVTFGKTNMLESIAIADAVVVFFVIEEFVVLTMVLLTITFREVIFGVINTRTVVIVVDMLTWATADMGELAMAATVIGGELVIFSSGDVVPVGMTGDEVLSGRADMGELAIAATVIGEELVIFTSGDVVPVGMTDDKVLSGTADMGELAIAATVIGGELVIFTSCDVVPVVMTGDMVMSGTADIGGLSVATTVIGEKLVIFTDGDSVPFSINDDKVLSGTADMDKLAIAATVIGEELVIFTSGDVCTSCYGWR